MSVVTSRPDLMIADPVGEPLHLVELVGREEHGPSLGDGLADEPLELVLHQRIEAGGRLVEDQQLGPVHERQHQADLLPVALRQLPRRTIENDLEALDQLVGVRRIAVRPGHARTSRCAVARSCAGTAPARRGGSRCAGGSRRCHAERRGRAPTACPPVGRCSARSIRIVVVFPAPFGPRKPNTCPRSTRRSRSITARVAPYVFVRRRASTAAVSIAALPGVSCLATEASLHQGRAVPRHGAGRRRRRSDREREALR